jgi:hypothetical protein
VAHGGEGVVRLVTDEKSPFIVEDITFYGHYRWGQCFTKSEHGPIETGNSVDPGRLSCIYATHAIVVCDQKFLVEK